MPITPYAATVAAPRLQLRFRKGKRRTIIAAIMAIPGDRLRQSENIAGCCKQDTSYDRRAGCGPHRFIVRAITEGPRAWPYRQERQRRDTDLAERTRHVAGMPIARACEIKPPRI